MLFLFPGTVFLIYAIGYWVEAPKHGVWYATREMTGWICFVAALLLFLGCFFGKLLGDIRGHLGAIEMQGVHNEDTAPQGNAEIILPSEE